MPLVESPELVAELMGELRDGRRAAAGALVERFYPDLRRMAAIRMQGEGAHTWQPTVLVNELYLELTRIKSLPAGPGGLAERDEFFALAAFLMRRLLAHHARPLRKRTIAASLSDAPEPAVTGEQSLREVENLLDRLGAIDPTLRAVVEMKVFEGLSRQEIAQRLGCSVRTVARHWDFAVKWLRSAMEFPGDS